jgi:hypothetical protein
MVRATNFFCQVNSLQCNLEDAIAKCEILKREVKDKMLLDDLEAISYRIDYAYYRMASIRTRAKNIFTYEDSKGL